MSRTAEIIRIGLLALGWIALLIVLAGIGLGIYGYSYLSEIEKNLPSLEKLTAYDPPQPSIIMSRDGEKIGELSAEKRYPTPLKQINPVLINAFLAAEDVRFYQHKGVDLNGTARAAIHYLMRSPIKQGGSTITQQLAKNILLSKEKTIERKVKDMLLAIEIEKHLSKSAIIELYLNSIFLGNQSYGVEAAARNYFRKPNTELSLAEAAMLAGLTPAPSAYAPTDHFRKAKVRQKFVLDQMLKNSFITQPQHHEALQQALRIYRAESPNFKARR